MALPLLAFMMGPTKPFKALPLPALNSSTFLGLAANPKNVEEFKAGNAKALNGLVGPIMKASKGKANPAQVNALLMKKLGS